MSKGGWNKKKTQPDPIQESEDMASKRSVKIAEVPDGTLTYGQVTDLKLVVDNQIQKQEKEKTKMTPTNDTPKVKRIQRSVFDLGYFGTVRLVKEVQMPEKPKEIEDALAMVGGNKERLLEVIYDGLVADATEQAGKDLSTFKLAGKFEEDEGVNTFVVNQKYLTDLKTPLPEENYTGKFADDDKEELINALVLNIAKMNGYDKNKTKDEKIALKEKARDLLRQNPVMIQGIQG